MKIVKKIYKTIVALVLAINMLVLPIHAAENTVTYVEPRFNNIFNVSLSLWFDSNKVAYCCISVMPYSHCTGFDGIMRLYDPNGNQLKSWSVSDFIEPYSIETTWQCYSAGEYTLTFQGYAYGDGTMYDDIVLSMTEECN